MQCTVMLHDDEHIQLKFYKKLRKQKFRKTEHITSLLTTLLSIPSLLTAQSNFIIIFVSITGPWIENLFIEYFIGKPFSSFNGIVPLFVQWSDYHLHYRGSVTSKNGREKSEAELYLPFTSKIRKHVLYVVISQANYGLGFLARKYPNVLIFSAGGEGEVPIPLIKGELPYAEIDPATFPKYDVSFLGSIDHGHRKKVLDNFVRLLDGTEYRYKMGPSKTWEKEM